MGLMSLRLIIEDDEGSTTIVPLGKDTITIGRQQGNTIQLTEKNVSRRHAQLLPEGESWVLEDLGSYNGVKVNGRVASGRVVLQEGDVVQIGDYHLALTEDVDRRSLNYDRGRAAANDGVEPMLASSSTNLPQLSAGALAALSSGQHPAHVAVAPAPSFIDSGQMPMVARSAVQREETPSRVGAMVLGLALIGGLALGGFWWMTRPSGTTSNASAKADSGKEQPAKATPSKPVPQSDTKVPVADTKIEPVPDTKIEPVPVPDTKVDPPIEDDPPDIVPDDPDPVADPEPTPKPKPDKPVAKPKPTPPKPTPPVEPAVDADALLADARKQILKSPSTAYDLASKAYAAKKSSGAAFLMASAACRMKDASKAKKAIAKLKGTPHDTAVQTCADNGITVE